MKRAKQRKHWTFKAPWEIATCNFFHAIKSVHDIFQRMNQIGVVK